MPQVVTPLILPPDGEFLSQYFLSDIVHPTPVATRLPQPDDEKDTVHDFVRVESGGGDKVSPMTPNPWYSVHVLMHTYGRVEMQAADTARLVTGHMAAARGQTVAGWYIVRVTHVVLPHRLSDPKVNLLRYRSEVTWVVAGKPE